MLNCSGWKIEKGSKSFALCQVFLPSPKYTLYFKSSDYVFYMHNFKKRPCSNSRKVRLCLFTMLFVAVLSDYIQCRIKYCEFFDLNIKLLFRNSISKCFIFCSSARVCIGTGRCACQFACSKVYRQYFNSEIVQCCFIYDRWYSYLIMYHLYQYYICYYLPLYRKSFIVNLVDQINHLGFLI